MPRATNKERRARRKSFFAAIFPTALIVLVLTGYFFGVFEPFERRLLDLRFTRFNQDLPVAEDIVFVEFDDRSLESLSQSFGGWPWPRGTVIAELMLDYIMVGKPKALLFDVLYSTYSPKAPGIDIPEEDWLMLEASMAYPNVSHAVLFKDDNLDESESMFEAAIANFAVDIDAAESDLELPSYGSYLAPYEPLRDYASLLHAVNHREDADGTSRRDQIVIRYGDTYYPGLALRGLDALLQPEFYAVENRELVMGMTDGSERRVPLTARGDYLLNFYPNNDEFVAYPADSIIVSAQNFFANDGGEVSVSPEAFTDKVVIIGASALDLKDLKTTPVGENIAGPYIHMTAMSNILLDQHLRQVPRWLSVVSIVLIIVAVVFVTLSVPVRILRSVGGILVIAGIIVGGALVFRDKGVVIEMASTLVAAVVSYFGALIYLLVTEAAEKNQISHAMSKHLAPQVMTKVLKNYDKLISETGESREIAILFSDIHSFSAITEGLPSEKVVDVLNQYLEPMIEVIFDNRGTIDKIIGDAIMAYWGAPVPEQQKTHRAVQTALSMIERLGELNRQFEERGDAPIGIGLGIHTGETIVGNVGSDRRFDYTAIGDNVNLGSRIERLTKYYKVPILVSEPAYNATREDFRYIYLDTVAVKGPTHGMAMYAPLETGNEGATPDYIDGFAAARKAYEAQDFSAAEKLFAELEAAGSNPLGQVSGVFKLRCARFQRSPPPQDWNGVWKMTEN